MIPKGDFISSININRESWFDKLFVTTDIDWACDEVLEFCYNFFDRLDINVTWFATHETKWNNIISSHPKFEIGSHPNFNNLLTDPSIQITADEVIKNNLNLIPATKIVRSHSTTVNSHLLDLFKVHGLEIESNIFMPYNSGIIVKPFFHCNGILRLPYIWSDDVHIAYSWEYQDSIAGIMNYEGLKLIDCHPIHIFLNTESIERYNIARPYLKDINQLKKIVNDKQYGTRNFIEQLIKSYHESSNNR